MTDRIVIGLGGRKRSGKDTVADFLVEDYGYTKYEMSGVLHEILLVLDPWVVADDTPEHLSRGSYRYSAICSSVGYVEAKKIPEVRRLLQTLGTEVGRNMLSEDIWAEVMRKKVLATEGHVVFTGLRYPNELAMLQELEGVAAWVDRPILDPVADAADAHSSENSLGPTDFNLRLLNDGDLTYLRRLAGWLHGNTQRKALA